MDYVRILRCLENKIIMKQMSHSSIQTALLDNLAKREKKILPIAINLTLDLRAKKLSSTQVQ